MLHNLFFTNACVCIIYSIWIQEFILKVSLPVLVGGLSSPGAFLIDYMKVTPTSSRCNMALTWLQWTIAFSGCLRYTCSVNVDLMVQITLSRKSERERVLEWESHIDFPDLTDS